MCIDFFGARTAGDYDWGPSAGNAIANGALYTIGGISLALVSKTALTALGFGLPAVSVAKAIGFTVAAISGTCSAVIIIGIIIATCGFKWDVQ